MRPRTLAGEVDKVAGVATPDQRAHANLADFTRFLGRLQPEAEVLNRRGVVAVRGRDDFPSARMAPAAGDDISADDFASADRPVSPRGREDRMRRRHGSAPMTT